MERILNIYKPQGMTPLQVIDCIRDARPEYRDVPMTYAGRLDPMAEGVLIVLAGEAVHEKESYMALDKIYEADIVLGWGTDTHDCLGMPTTYDGDDMAPARIETEIRNMEGLFEYALPIYSSKPVQGKPLFEWAREGRTGEIAIPKRRMRVHAATLIDRHRLSPDALLKQIEASIANVVGDFRQEAILDAWQNVLAHADAKQSFDMIRIRIHCESGTYVRTLAHELGKRLGSDAMVTRLIRAQVGTFTIDEAQRICR